MSDIIGVPLEINGVSLPPNVVDQLQRLGGALSLYHYTAAQLQDANVACSMDGNLVDDPHGVSFADKLELTEAEKRKRAASMKNTNIHDGEECDEEMGEHSFCERLARRISKITSFRDWILKSRANAAELCHENHA